MIASDANYDREEGDTMEHVTATSPAAIVPQIINRHKSILVKGGGGSKEFAKQIKSIGGKWVAKERGWTLNAERRDDVQNLIDTVMSSHHTDSTVPLSSSSGEDPTMTVDGPSTGTSSSVHTSVIVDSVPTGAGVGTISTTDVSGVDAAITDAPVVDILTVAVEPVTDDPGSVDLGPSTTELEEPASSVVEGEFIAADVFEPGSSALLTNPVTIVQLNTRSIAVLGDPPVSTHGDLNQHGKFSKDIKIGDQKHAGWTFTKNLLGTLQKLLPGVTMTPFAKPSSSSSASKSPSSRKSAAAVVGTSSKADTPASSPENKRKRQRTAKAEESAAQAHAPHAGEQAKVAV